MNGPPELLVDNSGDLYLFDAAPFISDDEAVTFSGKSRSTQSTSAYVWSNGRVQAVFGTDGSYGFLESPARNRRGTVVAYGSLGGIDRGIYMGGPGANAPVIQVGDTLAGSSVEALSFYRGLNERDQIAFWFRLQDGRSGVARANLPSGTPP